MGAPLISLANLQFLMLSRRLRPVISLFLLAFVAHAPALLGTLGGALPSTGDTLGAFAPWHEFVRRELHRNGAIPLWNPHVFCGVPFAGNGQSALFYPPTYLHFCLPEGIALWLFAFLHSAFFMVGGYFLGRTLGLKRRSAFLVALLLGFGNATPAHLFGGHLTFLPARSFWPWQAAFLLRILHARDTKSSFHSAIGWALCIALGLAAGSPQIWVFGVLFNGAIFLYWALRAANHRRFLAQLPWKSGAFALVLAALWCAPTLLPLRELKNWSSHGALLSFAEISDLSATPRSLFRLLLNGFFGGNSFIMWSLPSNPGEDAAGIGLAGAILALAAPFFAPKSRLIRALYAGCVLAILLALGSATPLLRVFYDHVFLFQILRVPARWLELWAFGAALLAGFCFDSWLKNPQSAGRMGPVWTLSALFCLALLWGTAHYQTPWYHGAEVAARGLQLPRTQIPALSASLRSEALTSVILAASVTGLLAVLWRRGLQKNRFAALFIALFAAEPLLNFWLSVRITPPEKVRNSQLDASLAAKFEDGTRWIVRAPFQQLNAPLGAGIDALNGYEPFGSAPFFEFARAAGAKTRFAADFQPQNMDPLWRVMGASHILWKPKFDGDAPHGFPGRTLANAGEWRLNLIEDSAVVPPALIESQAYLLDYLRKHPANQAVRDAARRLAQRRRDILKSRLKPWPRAYITSDVTIADEPKAVEELRKLASYPFNGAPPAVADSSYSNGGDDVLPMPQSHSKSFFQTPDVRIWRVQAAANAFFVENETMAPGWKAFVDEKPAKIHLANAIFRGVEVPSGARKVALAYDSQTLRFALFLSLCGLSGAAAIGFCSQRRALITGQNKSRVGRRPRSITPN